MQNAIKKVIKIRFSNNGYLEGTQYSFFTDLTDIKVDDWCVVKTCGFFSAVCVVQTEGLTPSEIKKATKWIVQKIDSAAFDAKIKKEALIQEIKNQLHARKKEAEEYLLYQQLANIDPTIKALLAQLQEISPESCPQLPPTVKE